MVDNNKLTNSNLLNLHRWFLRNGIEGYDPYDYKEWYHSKIIKYKNISIVFKVINVIERYFPLHIRKLLSIQKKKNAKAIGLLFCSYINMFKAYNIREYYNKAVEYKNWLISNYEKGYFGKSWGYPFDWYSRIKIPKGTPSSVVTACIGEGFWKDYKYNHDINSLGVCVDICDFFIKSLNIDKINDNMVCFSYTPIDDFHVHNANLFVAEFLIKIGIEINQEKYIELGQKAVNYSVSEQNKNGSIYYWGNIQKQYGNNHLDHYHTGFELRMLYSISRMTSTDIYTTAFEKYYYFYLKNFFTEEGLPKYSPDNLYPIDIHSCAESILCNTVIKSGYDKEFIKNLIHLINKKMLTSDGWYIYRIYKKYNKEVKVRIPYLRWGQAWMFRALSEFALIELNDN